MPKLKYLEMYGFKSFAEKTRLSFDKDFVAIVGPNGSGKSNISDAVRWVLGELSAKSIRGEKMEDVIFAGTRWHKPMNMAQVTLAFDNSDGGIDLPYEEVTVSRKVYRSGESQYLINRNQVRRKDVRNLFFDTGIGKEGYSLIGQGRIEDLLSNQSDDRRAIFDEAAGIAKFKYKKKEALDRLEKTEAHLASLRLDLRGKEQEARILKQQADNARKGVALTRELNQHELSLVKSQLDRADRLEEEIFADRIRVKKDLANVQEELDHCLALLAPFQSSIDQGQARLGELENRSRLLENKMSALHQEVSVRQEQVKFFTGDLERISQSLEKRSSRVRDLQEDRDRVKESIASLTREVEELKVQVSRLASEGDDEEEKDLAEEARLRLEKIRERLSFLEYEKERAQAQDRKLQVDQEEKRQAAQEEEGRLKELVRQKEEIDRSQKDLTEHLKQAGEGLTQVLEDLRTGEEKTRQAQETHRTLLEKLAARKSRRQVLQSLIDNFEGYHRSVQDLLRLGERDREVGQRIVGPLADLIEVKPSYERAVDVALGSALQNIVVESQEDGKFLIKMLKKKAIGRITFLPKDRIRGSRPPKLSEREIACMGMDAVQFPEDLRPILEHFLAKTVFTKDLDDAVALSKKKLPGIRIVSLHGDVINSWGSMVGGKIYQGNEGSLLNREIQVKKLEEEIQSLHKHIAQVENLLMQAEDERALLLKKREELDRSLNRIREEKEKLLEEGAEVSTKIGLCRDAFDRLQTFLQQKTTFSLEAYEKEKKNLVKDRDMAREALDKAMEKARESLTQAHEREKEEALLKDRLSFKERDLVLEKNKLADILERLEVSLQEDKVENEEKTALLARKENNEIFLKEAEEKEKAWSREAQQVLLDRKGLEGERADLEEKVADQVKRKEAALSAKNELEKEDYQLGIRLDQVKNRKVEIREDYRASYDLSLEAVEERLEKLVPVDTTRAKVNAIKKDLSKIGFFNYESIEAYDELAKEVDFLHQQVKDLKVSEEDIREMVSDLDRVMKDRFQQAFQEINEEYNRIFQVLFNGGRAKLTLDSEDTLQAGIDIQAQPPGKKLQSLALLSGGERSMTALALMFAIFSIHPAPFCFLDEIDASLDEANIGRYVRFIKTLTEGTQFIIITHRKTTMEPADMLYGITMDKGITRVVSLRFDQIEEEMKGEGA